MRLLGTILVALGLVGMVFNVAMMGLLWHGSSLGALAAVVWGIVACIGLCLNPPRWITRLQHVDSRIMYLLLAIVMAAPLIWTVNQPIQVSPAVKGAYNTIEAMPSDKIALIISNWGSGSSAENRPQIEAMIRHLFSLDKKFAMVAFNPEGSKFAYDSAAAIAKEMGKEYGEDWVNLGLRPVSNMVPLAQTFPRDFRRFVADMHGTPLAKIPVTKNVRSAKDLGLLIDITSTGELDIWIAYVYGPYRVPIVYAPTAVIAPEAFNPLDAGQIKGLLPGLQGAAAYERLIGQQGFASKAMGALSSSHVLIILLIIAGNIGYITSRRRAREESS